MIYTVNMLIVLSKHYKCLTRIPLLSYCLTTGCKFKQVSKFNVLHDRNKGVWKWLYYLFLLLRETHGKAREIKGEVYTV